MHCPPADFRLVQNRWPHRRWQTARPWRGNRCPCRRGLHGGLRPGGCRAGLGTCPARPGTRPAHQPRYAARKPGHSCRHHPPKRRRPGLALAREVAPRRCEPELAHGPARLSDSGLSDSGALADCDFGAGVWRIGLCRTGGLVSSASAVTVGAAARAAAGLAGAGGGDAVAVAAAAAVPNG